MLAYKHMVFNARIPLINKVQVLKFHALACKRLRH